MDEKTYSYQLTDTTFPLYPVEIQSGLMYYGEDLVEDVLELPLMQPLMGEWGKEVAVMGDSDMKFPMPSKIDVTWLSLAEMKCFSVYDDVPKKQLEEMWELKDKDEKPIFESIIVGMAPKGRLAVWLKGPQRCEQVMWAEGDEVEVPVEEFFPEEDDSEIEDYCQYYLDEMEDVAQNLQNVGIPSTTELDDMMQQYIYRYNVQFQQFDNKSGKWQEYPDGAKLPTIEGVGNLCTDASFDRLLDGRLLDYHKAAKPVCIYIKWLMGESDYGCYICLSPEMLQTFFDVACVEDPDEPIKIDVKVDWEQYKFMVSLKSEIMDRGIVIPEEMMKVIVFRAGSEAFKSKNFNLTDAAWEW